MHPYGVIFDIDGTAVDNHAYHEESWLIWSARNNRNIDRAFYREHLYARTNDQIFRKIYGDHIAMDEIIRRAEEKEAIYREIYAPVMEPMPGLVDLLEALHRADIPCAVASNAERVNVDFVVDGLKLRGFFRAVLAREDVVKGKPEPDLFLLAAERMGLPPARCRVFEDSWAGFEAAHRAGMPCFAITGHTRAATVPPHVRAQFADFRGVTLDTLAATA
jgi:HAD superfamily hydrolase (TIGR01509 family)